jgi:hypothetical protein
MVSTKSLESVQPIHSLCFGENINILQFELKLDISDLFMVCSKL